MAPSDPDASIHLRGVRVHNLQGIDVDIPLGRVTLVTGVSGAGKSSLVFDTLHAEAQRRYLQGFSVAARQFLERFDQPDAERIDDLPPSIALTAPDATSTGQVSLGRFTELTDLLAEFLSRVALPVCPQCGQEVRPLRTQDVVDRLGALPNGTRVTVAFPDRPADDESTEAWTARLQEEGWFRVRIGAVHHRFGEGPLPKIATGQEALVITDRVEIGKASAERLFETIDTTYRRGEGSLVLIREDGEDRYDRRWRCPHCQVAVAEPIPRRFDPEDPLGACPECRGRGTSDSGLVCSACHGRRFRDEALSLRWRGESVADLHDRTLASLIDSLADASVGPEAARLLAPIQERLGRLRDLGLDHLTLSRGLSTLATGEISRLRLAQAILASLVDVLYLFEEPTAGLHPVEVERILPHLLALRDAGNTLVLIDHHPALLGIADHLIDLGPGAGEEGGRLVYQGTPEGLRAVEDSVTREYLFDRDSTPSPPRARTHGELRLSLPPSLAGDGNDTSASVTFPLGVLCVVTGVSGAGKTRLVRDRLYPAVARLKGKKIQASESCAIQGAASIGEVVLMDRSPLPRSARSNPATYLKLFDDIRELYAQTTEARIRNFTAGAFSFNQPGGRCEACEGQGQQAVDMQFLAEVRTTCPECLGSRYRKEILQVKVRGLSIAEVLDLTVREAFRFFRAQRSLEKRLKWLLDVGVDYLRLGQSLDTLSLGEGQRLRLAGHLASSRKPRCLFLLLEPSAGLHPADIDRLLGCFDHLLSVGHSLILVDHHPDFLRNADHLIELGAGPAASRILAEGTPAEVARAETPTGRYLRTAWAGQP